MSLAVWNKYPLPSGVELSPNNNPLFNAILSADVDASSPLPEDLAKQMFVATTDSSSSLEATKKSTSSGGDNNENEEDGNENENEEDEAMSSPPQQKQSAAAVSSLSSLSFPSPTTAEKTPAVVTLLWKDGTGIQNCNAAMIAAYVGNVSFLECVASDPELRELLLVKGRAAADRTATEFSARGGHVAAARALLKAGLLTPLAQNASGLDARYVVATTHASLDFIKFLRDEANVPSLDFVHPQDGETLLHVCCRRCSPASAAEGDRTDTGRALILLKFLLEEKVYSNVEAKMRDSSNKESWVTPFAVAARYGCVEALQLLHRHGGSKLCLTECEQKLKHALERIRVPAGQSLQDQLRQLDPEDHRIFSKWQYFPVLEREQGIGLEERSPAVAHYYVTVERRRTYLNSPILRAAAGAHVEAMRYLLEIGFTIAGSKVKSVSPALYFATTSAAGEAAALAAMKFLCEEASPPADVNEVDSPERALTAVYGAAWMNRPSCVRYLLEKHRASTSIRYCNRSTVIYGAIGSGAIESLRVLLEFKVDLATPRGTLSPLEYAREMKKPDIVELLDAAISH